MNPVRVEAGESLKTVVVVNEAVQVLEAVKIDRQCVVFPRSLSNRYIRSGSHE
jgi:hypothetical protein